MTYHNLLSACVQGLVSRVLINHKMWEREQFKHLTRWGGQQSRNGNSSSRRGWWEGRTLLGLVATVRDGPASQPIYLASQMDQESAGLQTPRERVYSPVAKMWKVRHPISHMCKRKVSSHADLGFIFRKSCHRSHGGNRSNLKHLPSLRKRLWTGNAISMGKVNHLPIPTKIIPELKLT